MHGENKKGTQNTEWEKYEHNRLPERLRHGWEDNIRMNLSEIYFKALKRTGFISEVSQAYNPQDS
jgi:hypothetical protein